MLECECSYSGPCIDHMDTSKRCENCDQVFVPESPKDEHCQDCEELLCEV